MYHIFESEDVKEWDIVNSKQSHKATIESSEVLLVTEFSWHLNILQEKMMLFSAVATRSLGHTGSYTALRAKACQIVHPVHSDHEKTLEQVLLLL